VPKPLPAGPYELLDIGTGARAPWYILPFDKAGVCTAPKTRAHLLATLAAGGFTHVFLFSHGWNNDWKTSTKRYRDFIDAFTKVRQAAPGGAPGSYRPLLVGVFWPSTALVLPWEKPPVMAAAAGDPRAAADEAVEEGLDELAEIAPELPAGQRERFYELAGAERLSGAEALELAALLAPLYGQGGDPEDGGEVPAPETLLGLWRALPAPPAPAVDPDDFGFAPDATAPAGPPAAAFDLSSLDPRGAVRAFTVWQMKDRAGTVGANGVAPLLRALLAAAGGARLQLLGHSYGCKVVLSALAGGAPLAAGAVDSVLLLQPAINGWAFAEKVEGEDFPGGYRKVLPWVRQPILTTFTRKDGPLTKMFHLAVRRKRDLGEVQIGAAAPNRFAALGGFGAQGGTPPEVLEIAMPTAGTAYPAFDAGTRVVALAAHDLIGGHGDIVNPHTAWALLTQVRSTMP
jgi:hypothetical protein